MKKITQTKKSNPNAPTGSKANKAYNKMELNVYKEGGSKFPDLTGDGKVTRADILKGRGVLKKGGESKNWIKGAIKRPGAFSAKAEKAGMSTAAYAAKVTKPGSTASTQTKRQANLAKTLGKMRKKK
jgi:hypothetical protein